ncbi:MAG: DNA polymerase III subunit delta [Tissierellia bacterium]|nr:DNA polymerase III subunit delta [Tissierellia bacterium]
MDYIEYNKQISLDKLAGNSWLFIGEENYMMNNMVAKTAEKLLNPAMAQINYVELSATSLDTSQINTIYQTLPMMDQVRIVVIKHADEISGSVFEDELLKTLENMPEHVIGILVDSYDEVKKTGKLYKRHKKMNTVVEFGKLKPQQFQGFIKQNLKENNMHTSPEVISRLHQLSGYGSYGSDLNLFDLKQALNKVAAAYDKPELIMEDFIPFWPSMSSGNIFEFIDALFSGDEKKTIKIYKKLYGEQEPPLRILAMIVRHLRLRNKLQTLRDEGFGPSELMSELGIKNFEFRKLSSLPRLKNIRELMELCEETELKMKSVGSEVDLMMEVLISKIIIVIKSNKK